MEMFYFHNTLNTSYFTVIWKEGSVLFNEGRMEARKCFIFNDALNTFTLRLYGRKEGRKEMFYLTKEGWKEIFIKRHTQHILFYGYIKGRKEMFYFTTHSTHFTLRLYGRKEGRKCFHSFMGARCSSVEESSLMVRWVVTKSVLCINLFVG